MVLFAASSFAQTPALRVLPEPPRADLRVYLEIDLPPCRVAGVGVSPQGPGVRSIAVLTRACVANALDVGKYVVQLGPLPEGPMRLDVTIDSTSRSLAFAVGAPARPIQPGQVIDGAEFIDGQGAQADRILRLSRCFSTASVAVPVNDTRTEIIVDLLPPFLAGCIPEGPFLRTPVGFPRPGQHVILARIDGVVISTQFVVVEKGFEKLDYSDLWWIEAESGWGLTIQQHDKDRLFAVIFGYRGDGKPLWLSLSGGEWDSATSVTGPFNVSRGTPQSGPYDPARGSQATAALGTLEFLSADTATLTLRSTFGFPELGIPSFRSWTLKRQPF